MNGITIPPAAHLSGAFCSVPFNSPPRVLVVDDDESILRINTFVLARAGYAVDTAKDGADAWAALNRASYDLLVTDNMMPKVTGLDLLHLVRGARMKLPVIMASGNPPHDQFDLQPSLKPNALLCKPYLLEELVQTARSLLENPTALHGVSTPQNNTP